MQLTRKCPLCSSPTGSVLHTQQFIIENDNPLDPHINIVTCDYCQFIFSDSRSIQKDYNNYYARISSYDNEELGFGNALHTWDKDRLQEVVNLFADKNLNLNILDIGSATGGLLQLFEEKGFKNLFGLDPSNRCIDKITSKASSIKAFQGNLSDDLGLIFGEKKFDLIILSHVLEHVFDVNSALKNVMKILNEDGLIYIEVPDSSRYKDLVHAPFHYFSLEHINHFTDLSLKTLLGLHGLKVLQCNKKTFYISETEQYPAIYGLFALDKELQDFSAYIELSSQSKNHEVLNQLINNNVPVAIWGAGMQTMRLLGDNKFKELNIRYLVDSDKNKQGRKIGNLFVQSPENLKDFQGTILISSPSYHQQITQQIRNAQYTNKVIPLNV